MNHLTRIPAALLLLACLAAPTLGESFAGRLKLIETPLTWVVLDTGTTELRIRPNSPHYQQLHQLAQNGARLRVEGTRSAGYLDVESYASLGQAFTGTLKILKKPLSWVILDTGTKRYRIRPNSPHYGALRNLAKAGAQLRVVGRAVSSYLVVESYQSLGTPVEGRLELVQSPLTWVVLSTGSERFRIRPNSPHYTRLHTLAEQTARVRVLGTANGEYFDVEQILSATAGQSGLSGGLENK